MTVPMRSAGSRSGVNWTRANLRVDGVAERSHRERLGEPGHAFEQHVPPREQTDENALDHVGLADDDLADLVHQAFDEGALFGDELVQCPDVVHGSSERWGVEEGAVGAGFYHPSGHPGPRGGSQRPDYLPARRTEHSLSNPGEERYARRPFAPRHQGTEKRR